MQTEQKHARYHSTPWLSWQILSGSYPRHTTFRCFLEGKFLAKLELELELLSCNYVKHITSVLGLPGIAKEALLVYIQRSPAYFRRGYRNGLDWGFIRRSFPQHVLPVSELFPALIYSGVGFWRLVLSTMLVRNVFQILAFALYFSCSFARKSHRSLLNRHSNIIANRSLHYGEDSAAMSKRDGAKYVFMHHIMGNTYPYTSADWKNDIQLIQGSGVDALALNLGALGWEQTQVANAYAAAESLGSGFKLFISFDFTSFPCTPSTAVSMISQYANHPNQFKVNGKSMVSSFEGSCLQNSGWASLKAQTNAFLMPFISGLEGRFSDWPALDSWLCWGCTWPAGNNDISTADDYFYLNQLGSRYATSVSGWMFTHFSFKNFYQRGDNWLINERWEEIMSLRERVTFVEMETWNDYGESDYFGPIKGAQPQGTTWATGFSHLAWLDMSRYYITGFKTGSYPAITEDVIYYWARPHPAAATASGDPLPKPSGFDWAEDFMWAAVFATSKATVMLQCGGSSSTFSVNPGVTKLKIPLAAGAITVRMTRNGQTIINQTPQDYTYVLNPTLYNYNAYVGSATSGNKTPAPISPPPSPSPPTTPISKPSSTSYSNPSLPKPSGPSLPNTPIARPSSPSYPTPSGLKASGPIPIPYSPGSTLSTGMPVTTSNPINSLLKPTPTQAQGTSSRRNRCSAR